MGNPELTHAREGTGQTLALPWQLHRLGVPISPPISSGSCPYIQETHPGGC